MRWRTANAFIELYAVSSPIAEAEMDGTFLAAWHSSDSGDLRMLYEGQVTLGHVGAEFLSSEALSVLDTNADTDMPVQTDRFAARPARRSGQASQVDLHPCDRELVALSLVIAEADTSLTTSDRVAAIAGYRPASSEPRVEAAARAVVDAMHDLMGRPAAEWSDSRTSLDEALTCLNGLLTGRGR